MKKLLNKSEVHLKRKVWSIYTRLFHILLIVTIVTAYITIESENNIVNHVLAGYVAALIVLFRIIWGFIDVKCSRHKDLVGKIPELTGYFKDLLLRNEEKHIGHNPASSVYILLMMITLVLIAVSGSLLYGIQENGGIFAHLNSTHSDWMLFLGSFHSIATDILLILITVHVVGVVLNLIVYDSDRIMSMVTGKRDNGSDFDVILTLKQNIFGAVWILTVLSAMIYFYNNPDNVLTENQETEINFREESYETRSSCGSCHMIYPPYLLPKQSWNKMMDNLENHFGKDASLPKEETELIRSYLMNNAAEHSTREAAVKILDNLKTDAPQEITQTHYWKETHKDITKEQFEADYGIKSDCRTCHKTIRDGMIQDEEIKFEFK